MLMNGWDADSLGGSFVSNTSPEIDHQTSILEIVGTSGREQKGPTTSINQAHKVNCGQWQKVVLVAASW